MNTRELTASDQQKRPWWYVQPVLLTAFISLLVMWMVVWKLMGVYLADVRVISSLSQCAQLFARLGDITTGLIVNH